MRRGSFPLLILFASGGLSLAHAPSETTVHNPSPELPFAGTSLLRFAKVDDGTYKGSKPRTDADFNYLESLHVKYILELKFLPLLDGAEKKKAKKYGMGFLTVQMNASFDPLSEKHVNQALRILRDLRYQPIYLHCDIGRDRTSLVAGLYDVYFKGMSREDAWQGMKSFGFKESWALRGLRCILTNTQISGHLNSHPTDCLHEFG
jgi:Tyrosine phosphatase family